MLPIPLILAPDPIFKKKSAPVILVDDSVRGLMQGMLATIYQEDGVGIAAPMVGISQQIVVIDLQANNIKQPIFMANPTILDKSAETQTFEEGSLCFPGIKAEITRPKYVKVEYLDYDNQVQTIEAEGFLATVIQHEIDYLNGKVFLDYLSPIKRDMLTRKMLKFIKSMHNHVHTEHCNH